LAGQLGRSGDASHIEASVAALRRLESREREAVAHSLGPLDRTARAELALSVGIVIALPLTSVVIMVLMRRRVLLPLRNLFVVGWAVSAVNNRHLVLKALEMAVSLALALSAILVLLLGLLPSQYLGWASQAVLAAVGG
jgi:hypothetical protein